MERTLGWNRKKRKIWGAGLIVEKKRFHPLASSKLLTETPEFKTWRSCFSCIGKFSVLSFHKFARNQERLVADKFRTPAKIILWTCYCWAFGATFRQHSCEDNIWSIWTKMFAILNLYQSTRATRCTCRTKWTCSQHIFSVKGCMKKKTRSFDILT